MNEIQHIIFDLGNVLVKVHPDKAILNLSDKCNIPVKEIKTLFLSNFHKAFMKGLYNPEEFFDIIATKYQCSLSRSEYIDIWSKIIGKPKDGIEELIMLLKSKFTLSICSNIDPLHWKIIEQNINFIHDFKYHFLSFQMKMIKPNLKVFSYILNFLSTTGEQCVFIDDIGSNVKAAGKYGFHGIVANNSKQIIKGLKKYNIEI